MNTQLFFRCYRAWWVAVLTGVLLVPGTWAQEQKIYRCGNEYTNKPITVEGKTCKLVEGGNVTVVQSAKPVGVTPSKAVSSVQRSEGVERSAEQKSRDTDARAILEAELKKSEARLSELQKEYNKGEPEKMGPENKNHQKYLDRVSELKSGIERHESDIAGIKRELSRLR